MSSLPRPPKWMTLLPGVIDKIGHREIKDFVAEANKSYHHWEKVRYLPTPKGVTSEQVWTLVKFNRQSNRQTLPLLDERERPFSFALPSHIQEVLHEVDRGGGTDLLSDESPGKLRATRDQLIMSSLMEEAIATSQIEGAVTTRLVAKEMLRSNRKPRDRSEQMIANSYKTIQWLRTHHDQPLSVPFLLEIQEMMTAGTLDDPGGAGRFRTEADNVRIVDMRDEEVVFVPPPAKDLPERLAKFIAFANQKHVGADFIHPLVKASILHFWLAYEHPFIDGNGRTARTLFYWEMLRQGYWLFEFLTISRVILAAPAKYYRSFLYSEHDENDLTYSILYQIEATQKALKQLHEHIAEKRKEQQLLSSLWFVPGLNSRQRELIRLLLRSPEERFTFVSYARRFGISHLTARKDLLGLETKKWLTVSQPDRALVFSAAPDMVKRVRSARPER